jgi:hypothetical protein
MKTDSYLNLLYACLYLLEVWLRVSLYTVDLILIALVEVGQSYEVRIDQAFILNEFEVAVRFGGAGLKDDAVRYSSGG